MLDAGRAEAERYVCALMGRIEHKVIESDNGRFRPQLAVGSTVQTGSAEGGEARTRAADCALYQARRSPAKDA